MIIFICSIIYSFFVLLIEWAIGIGIDYHPDSLTYLNFSESTLVGSFIESPLDFIGSFYYVIVAFFDRNIITLIGINIIVFALTNLIIFLRIRNILYQNGYFYFIFSLLLIFDPYRAHLSIHILKDTIIIFSFIFMLYFLNSFFSIFFLILGFFMRFQFYGYLPIIYSFLKKKNNNFVLFVILLVSLPLLSLSELQAGDKASLAFRDFDRIPNFTNLGYPYGDILRFFIWPIIRITNLAMFFHPIYFLFFFQAMALIYLIYYNRYYINHKILVFFLIIGFIALSAPGYNSFLRYTQPVMTALFLWVVSLPLEKLEFLKKKYNRSKFMRGKKK